MTHREIIELLPWYVNNTLAESERTRIAGHLDDCAACAQEVQTLRAMESHLISLDSEIGGLAPDASTFAHNLAGEPPPSLQEKVLRLFIPPGGFALDRGGLMPLAACLLLAIVGYQNFRVIQGQRLQKTPWWHRWFRSRHCPGWNVVRVRKLPWILLPDTFCLNWTSTSKTRTWPTTHFT